MSNRTRGWSLTRIELAIGIAILAFGIFVWVAGPGYGRSPAWCMLAILAMFGVPAVFGLAWMIRIFRGPRDEPPPWRYRDR